MSESRTETEAISSPTTEGGKKKFDPGFARNLKIIGGVFAIGVFLLLFVFLLRSGNSRQETRASDLQMRGGGTQPTTGDMTPNMEKMLREQQQVEAAAAAKKGQSYIPPDTVGRTEAVAPPVAAITPSSYEAATIAKTVSGETNQHRLEGLERQLAGLAQGPETARVRVMADRSTTTATAATGPAGTQVAAKKKELVPGLEIVAGTLGGDLTVPAGSTAFASAVVESGAMKGGFMVGTARVIDEALEIRFTQMRYDNKMYVIDAIVLDQQTVANAIAGNVDRRILQRYIMPVALAAAQGFYTAKAAVGSVLTEVGNSAAVTTPVPSGEQARAAGIAEGLKIAGQEVQKAAAAPIVVSAQRGTSVGIMFRTPVTEEVAK